MNKLAFGCIVATIALFTVPNAQADTVTKFDVSMSGRQLTPNETTNIFFGADSQSHMPANPTTGMLIAPVAVGRSFKADESNTHAGTSEAPTEISSNVEHENVPATNLPSGGSAAVLSAVALGLIPTQSQQSDPSEPNLANSLPPTLLLFATALIGLLGIGRGRLKSG